MFAIYVEDEGTLTRITQYLGPIEVFKAMRRYYRQYPSAAAIDCKTFEVVITAQEYARRVGDEDWPPTS